MNGNQKLKTDDVRYLSFEGGGGKGGAFIGVIWALEDLKILEWKSHPKSGRRVLNPQNKKKIIGISGSSAGALTALLLSCGYTTTEIQGIVLQLGKKGIFYDDPLPLKKPKVDLFKRFAGMGGCSESIAKTELNYYDVIIKLLLKIPVIGDSISIGLILFGDKEPLKRIVDKNNFSKYVWNLAEDFGFMSGCNMRRNIDELIAFKTRGKNNEKKYNCTFQQHYKYHDIKLVVTGTNMETGRTQYFSVDDTPDFIVADAVRISMSFPFVFKPIIIPDGKYKGTWIDGGLLNNIPIHAFDSPPGGIINDNLLGIRLDKDKPISINSLGDFAKAFLGLIIAGSTELSQIVTEKERNQTLMIDIGKLSTLDFDPPLKVLKEAIENAVKAVWDYFNITKPIEPPKVYPAEKE